MLVLGNWKMHQTLETARELGLKTAEAAKVLPTAVTVGICPNFLHIPVLAEKIPSAIWLGGQDCHAQTHGAYTGDTSATMLKDVGCRFTLVGHSERREAHHESNALVRHKAEAALSAGLHAVICVGESQQQREQGDYLKLIERQVRECLPAGAGKEEVSFAYEPIWAIGSSKAATCQDIEEVHKKISSTLAELQGETTSRVLYGGTVKANNALEILSLPVVDGVLVGSASLDAAGFSSIIHAAVSALLQKV